MRGRASVSRTGVVQFASSATLVAMSLVLSHELVYLARYGSAYGEALVHSGHGVGWSRAVAVVVALGLLLALAGAGQLVRLARAAAAARPQRPGRPAVRVLASRWLRAWGYLSAATLALLTIQENAERAATGLAAPGLGLLATPEYAWGWAIAIAVAAVVSLVAVLFAWRRDVLLARIRATRRGIVRSATPVLRPRLPHAPRRRHLGRSHGLRAPPSPAIARPALA